MKGWFTFFFFFFFFFLTFLLVEGPDGLTELCYYIGLIQ